MAWLQAALDLIFPPVCLGCGIGLPSSRPPLFCAACADEVQLLAPPLCSCCGRPLAGGGVDDPPPARDHGNSALAAAPAPRPAHHCGACLLKPPRFEKARAAVLYAGEAVTKSIQTCKYQGDLAPLATFATLARQAPALGELDDCDLILPVPLHPQRLRQRGFNQALLLARCFFPEQKAKINGELLLRQRPTATQTGMSGGQRRRNLRGAFAVARPELVRQQRILLIDDVFTTGSTVNECAKVLTAAGAARVQVMTLARVKE